MHIFLCNVLHNSLRNPLLCSLFNVLHTLWRILLRLSLLILPLNLHRFTLLLSVLLSSFRIFAWMFLRIFFNITPKARKINRKRSLERQCSEILQLVTRDHTFSDITRLNDLAMAEQYAQHLSKERLGFEMNNLYRNSSYQAAMISQSLNKKNDCYDLTGTKDLIIINVLKYTNAQPRTGSEKDVERLENAFDSRGFNISRKLTNGEVLYNQVKAALKSYISSDAKPSFLTIAIMAHGDEEDRVLFSDGHRESVYKILEPIFKSSKFLGIPKLILCQFCRGYSRIYAGQDNYTLDSADLKKHNINSFTDTIYYFATAKGNPAMRSKNGSPFITSFCRVFQREPDLMAVSFEVNREVADQEFQTSAETYRVVPVFNHSLRKRIVFS